MDDLIGLFIEKHLILEQSPNKITPTNSVFNMTLRDYFAAKIMQGEATTKIDIREYDLQARRAYRMADEMLKEREKNGG